MKKGLTFMALIITVIVIIILSATAIVSYSSIEENARKNEFAKEAYTVLKLVKDYEFRNNEYPLLEEITVQLSSLDSVYREQFSKEAGYSSGQIKLKKIDLSKADVTELSRGLLKTTDDIYVFSENTKKIYYLKGVKIGDKIYYTLTDELYKLIGISEIY